MSETRREFDPDFKDGAVRIVIETGELAAQLPQLRRQLIDRYRYRPDRDACLPSADKRTTCN